MSKNTRNFPKRDDESLKETIRKLKGQIRRLRKQNDILKTENKTLIDAWIETEEFLSEVTKDVPVEDLLNKDKKKVKEKIVKSIKVDPEVEREKFRLKMKKWREENL